MANYGNVWENNDNHIAYVEAGYFEDAFNYWLTEVIKIVNNHYAKYYESIASVDKAKVTIKRGKSYYKVIVDNRIYAFVSIENGDILRPENLNRPAKNARGNIFEKASWVCCGPIRVK
jgi:hypothetical protein